MLTNAQSAFYMALSTVLALAFLGVLRRFWPTANRRQHNDLIGWQITVLGTTYAVIIGFMLFAVWTNFQVAQDNAEAEADCLVNVASSAEGLPADSRITLQRLAVRYAELMVSEEWPAMQKLQVSPAATDVTRQLWSTASHTQVHNASEQVALEHTMAELRDMTEHRRTRQTESREALPSILWTVLLLGGVITVMYSCLFGTDNLTLHIVQVVTLTFMLGLVLIAIAEVNHPFQGSVHVPVEAFQRAQETLIALQNTPR